MSCVAHRNRLSTAIRDYDLLAAQSQELRQATVLEVKAGYMGWSTSEVLMQTIMFVLQQSLVIRPRSADTALSRKLAHPTHMLVDTQSWLRGLTLRGLLALIMTAPRRCLLE